MVSDMAGQHTRSISRTSRMLLVSRTAASSAAAGKKFILTIVPRLNAALPAPKEGGWAQGPTARDPAFVIFPCRGSHGMSDGRLVCASHFYLKSSGVMVKYEPHHIADARRHSRKLKIRYEHIVAMEISV